MKNAKTGKVYTTLYVPPNKVNPKMDVFVNVGADTYQYTYQITNGEGSKQDISSLELEIKNQFEHIQFPDNWYYRQNRTQTYIRITHKIMEVPKYDEDEQISFESDLQIGEELEFTVSSLYPPSVVTIFVSGQPKKLSFHFVHPPTMEVQKIRDRLMSETENDRGLQLKTIGPRKLPDDITNTALLDTLNSYLDFSCDTTWIPNRGICRSLQAKLDNVDRQLERGHTKTATNNLQAFLNEVEAVRRNHLTSEGYGLLWFNGQHLLEQLSN
jgi:hypothetical protein